ncbi:nucleotidyl transferase, partial [bacterium]|nr:nucleotidyl transferase [bacterium]
PKLGHIIDKLLSENITKATFVVGYLGEKIVEYVNEIYPNLEASFVTQEIALGLGHAIHVAAPTIDEEEIFIILGDTIFDVKLHDVFSKKLSSLGVKTVEDPSRFGVAVCENGRIKKLIEKPQTLISNLALTGLYYIRNSKLLIESLDELFEKDIRTRGEYQLTDALQLMIEKGEEFSTFQVDGWYDCGKTETLLSTNQFILQSKGTNRNINGSIIIDPVFIAESAVVHNSVIGPFATIAEHCEVSESIIRNSILCPSAKVEKSMLDNSIIGMNAVVKGNYKKLNAGDSSEIEFY